jgi:hypothetical protein
MGAETLQGALAHSVLLWGNAPARGHCTNFNDGLQSPPDGSALRAVDAQTRLSMQELLALRVAEDQTPRLSLSPMTLMRQFFSSRYGLR